MGSDSIPGSQRASLAGWLVLSVAVVALFTRHELFATSPAAIALQVLAGLLWIWARFTFGRRSFHGTAAPTEGELVTRGPYRFLRHPIYASLLYFIGAGVATHLSLISVAAGAVSCAAVALRVVAEERALTAVYPEYTAYAARTKRFIPFML